MHHLSSAFHGHPRDVLLLHAQALKERSVQFIVAPYEADAQMAYLALRGDVWAVITEDSDLLAYGCPRVSAPFDKMFSLF